MLRVSYYLGKLRVIYGICVFSIVYLYLFVFDFFILVILCIGISFYLFYLIFSEVIFMYLYNKVCIILKLVLKIVFIGREYYLLVLF